MAAILYNNTSRACPTHARTYPHDAALPQAFRLSPLGHYVNQGSEAPGPERGGGGGRRCGCAWEARTIQVLQGWGGYAKPSAALLQLHATLLQPHATPKDHAAMHISYM